jgi:hypothetical protein
MGKVHCYSKHLDKAKDKLKSLGYTYIVYFICTLYYTILIIY